MASDGLGADVDVTPAKADRLDATLFGEAQSRIVISAAPSEVQTIFSRAERTRVRVTELGTVQGASLVIAVDGAPVLDLPREEMVRVYESAIPSRMS